MTTKPEDSPAVPVVAYLQIGVGEMLAGTGPILVEDLPRRYDPLLWDLQPLIRQSDHLAVLTDIGMELIDRNAEIADHLAAIAALQEQVRTLEAKLNAPELHDFAAGVVHEAAHQRERWGSDHDAGKEPQDWFWLLGYLAGKALKAHASGDQVKALHHTISSAAALANWHASILGVHTAMRPGIDPVARGVETIAAVEARRNP